MRRTLKLDLNGVFTQPRPSAPINRSTLADNVHDRYVRVSRHQSAGSVQYPTERSSPHALESRLHPVDFDPKPSAVTVRYRVVEPMQTFRNRNTRALRGRPAPQLAGKAALVQERPNSALMRVLLRRIQHLDQVPHLALVLVAPRGH